MCVCVKPVTPSVLAAWDFGWVGSLGVGVRTSMSHGRVGVEPTSTLGGSVDAECMSRHPTGSPEQGRGWDWGFCVCCGMHGSSHAVGGHGGMSPKLGLAGLQQDGGCLSAPGFHSILVGMGWEGFPSPPFLLPLLPSTPAFPGARPVRGIQREWKSPSGALTFPRVREVAGSATCSGRTASWVPVRC